MEQGTPVAGVGAGAAGSSSSSNQYLVLNKFPLDLSFVEYNYPGTLHMLGSIQSTQVEFLIVGYIVLAQ